MYFWPYPTSLGAIGAQQQEAVQGNNALFATLPDGNTYSLAFPSACMFISDTVGC